MTQLAETELLESERSKGAILLHRRIKDLHWYKAMKAQHRHVVTEIIWMARWRDGMAPYRLSAVPVKRGQVFASELTIAKAANCTRREVRTTLKVLQLNHFIEFEKCGPKVEPVRGPKPRLITILNYDTYQSLDSLGGPKVDQQNGHNAALRRPHTITREDHSRSQDHFKLPSAAPPAVQPEPTQLAILPEPETKEPEKPPGPRSQSRSDVLSYRLTETLWPKLRGGGKFRFKGPRDGPALKDLLALGTDEEIEKRWCIGISSTGYLRISNIGQFLDKWNDLAGIDLDPTIASKLTDATDGFEKHRGKNVDLNEYRRRMGMLHA